MKVLTGTLVRRSLATLVTVVGVVLIATTGVEAVAASDPAEVGVRDGSVALSDTAAGVPLFEGPPMRHGESRDGCLAVVNESDAPTRTLVFGETTGNGLDAHLELAVVRGTLPDSVSGSCFGFRPDPTDHAGLGKGVLYRGTLRAFPDDAVGGLVDPEVWQPGDAHGYRFVIRLAGDAPQGLTAGQSFVWQTAIP